MKTSINEKKSIGIFDFKKPIDLRRLIKYQNIFFSLFFYNASPAAQFVRFRFILYQNFPKMSPKNWVVFIQKACRFYMFSLHKYLVVLKKNKHLA